MPLQQYRAERSFECMLLGLPVELLCQHVLSRVEACTLARLELSCRFFRSFAEQAACQKLTTCCGNVEAQRFQ